MTIAFRPGEPSLEPEISDPLYMQPVMPLTIACSFAFLCAQVLGLI